MKTLNFGIVGYKFMGKAHSNALSRLPMFFETDMAIRKKALCGRDKEWAEQAAQTLGWDEVETDWRKLVARDDIDVIDITAPSNFHKEIALGAAQHGKHIFCEKPLALNLADAREMLDAANAAGVKHQIGFNYRFAPALVLAKQLIDQGKLGKIFHFRGSFLQDWIIDPEFPKVWRLDKKVCGSGSLGDLGAHVIDAARYLVGDMKTVTGMSKTFVKERPVVERMTGLSGKAAADAPREAVDVDDATSFVCEFENGALGLFEATRFAQGHKNDMSLEVNGEKGSIRFEFERMNELHYFSASDEPGEQGWRLIQVSEGIHPYWSHWWPTGHVIGFPETFCHQLYEFVQSIEQDKPCVPSFEDGVKCAQIMEAVDLSIDRRAWVDVDSL
ncbi:Gfo/Idh/MocA family oxidoreductase [Eubacteriales bacterium OttesenSCG-928-N13]|nr:Gfo/Idh/MocA family oxidoreductase [Eubacteriales bacterium OttesenSCG-928-N13]